MTNADVLNWQTRTHTDSYTQSIAQDILNTPDSLPEMREWAQHTLSLPTQGGINLPGEKTPGPTNDTAHTGSTPQNTTNKGGGPKEITATDKQKYWLIKMGQEKEITGLTIQHLTATILIQDICDRALDPTKFVTKGEAGKALDVLFHKDTPRKARVLDTTPPTVLATTPKPSNKITEDGMYRLGDRIVKVQKARETDRLYAKELIRHSKEQWSFEYAPGLIHSLTPDMRMTLAEAKEFGALYGTCCVCGRKLTDETSIAEGIGPICARRV